MSARLRAVLLSCALSAAACAKGPRPAAPPPPPKPQLPAASDRQGCSSPQYGLLCDLPESFVVTQQGPGPGTVLTLLKRSLTGGEAPGLKVRVIPLKGRSLKAFVASRIIAPLSKASGVSDLTSRPARLGGFAGSEVALTRAYASGRTAWRIFCFRGGSDAFIVEYTTPLDGISLDRPARTDELAAFVGSIRFK